MLKKEDKDRIIEHLKNTLIKVNDEVNSLSFDPDDNHIDMLTVNKINDIIFHALADVTW